MRALGFLLTFLVLPVWAMSMRPGDVILQPMRCYLCRLIEMHEESSFSHMGVVVDVEGERVWVAEALGVVRLVELGEFLQKGGSTREHLWLRPRESGPFPLLAAVKPWLGAPYDHEFRWNNVAADGREKLYCSELVAKLLNLFLVDDLPTKTMDYSRHRTEWERYFRGQVPDGLPGNSPADFERSAQFDHLGNYLDGVWNLN